MSTNRTSNTDRVEQYKKVADSFQRVYERVGCDKIQYVKTLLSFLDEMDETEIVESFVSKLESEVRVQLFKNKSAVEFWKESVDEEYE